MLICKVASRSHVAYTKFSLCFLERTYIQRVLVCASYCNFFCNNRLNCEFDNILALVYYSYYLEYNHRPKMITLTRYPHVTMPMFFSALQPWFHIRVGFKTCSTLLQPVPALFVHARHIYNVRFVPSRDCPTNPLCLVDLTILHA